MTAAAGFLLACAWHIDFWLLISTLLGTSLVIASACVFNNYLDRGIDRQMARTKKRALVTGEISGRQALIYATVLGLIGFGLLVSFVNIWVVFIGLVGYIDYLVFYGFFKRQSVYGTIVGSISGATALTAGYVAVSGRIDTAAWLLFLIMVLWQMPHFYAIAMYRAKDYAAAHIPVLPVKQGMQAAKMQILLYIPAFIIACSLLTAFGYTGYIYLIGVVTIGTWWLTTGLLGMRMKDTDKWARQMFGRSLLVLLSLSVLLALGSVLP